MKVLAVKNNIFNIIKKKRKKYKCTHLKIRFFKNLDYYY